MPRRWVFFLALLAALGVYAPGQGQSPDTKDVPKKEPSGKKTAQEREGNLRIGDAAPDFTLKDLAGKKTVTLSQLKGKPVVLYFGSCT